MVTDRAGLCTSKAHSITCWIKFDTRCICCTLQHRLQADTSCNTSLCIPAVKCNNMLMAEEAAVLQHVALTTAATLMLCLDQIS